VGGVVGKDDHTGPVEDELAVGTGVDQLAEIVPVAFARGGVGGVTAGWGGGTHQKKRRM
jgi:hypothetical protein